MYTIFIIEMVVKCSGQIEKTNVQFQNIRSKYYDFKKGEDIMRLVCEITYLIILILYIWIEVN